MTRIVRKDLNGLSISNRKEYNKQYYQNNKEKQKQAQKIWYQNNKESKKERCRQYNAKNKEKRNERSRKYNITHMDHLLDWRLKRRYGISLLDYEKLFKTQKGSCPICGKHFSVLLKRLTVDHNHSNGMIRGLLCDKCNKGLGFFEDNIDMLKEAINYLIKTNDINI